MAQEVLLLITTTLSYAGYNVCLKLSGEHVPKSATTPVLATICIQLGAMAVSLMFIALSSLRGQANFSLTKESYLFGAMAGVSVGFGGLGYLKLFSGTGSHNPMAGSLAIPTIVSGTIVISMLISALILKENVVWTQVVGTILILIGIVLLFTRIGTPANIPKV